VVAEIGYHGALPEMRGDSAATQPREIQVRTVYSGTLQAAAFPLPFVRLERLAP